VYETGAPSQKCKKSPKNAKNAKNTHSGFTVVFFFLVEGVQGARYVTTTSIPGKHPGCFVAKTCEKQGKYADTPSPSVRTTPSVERFYTQNNRFAKPGSGKNMGKAESKGRFVQYITTWHRNDDH
jgi:hypothetical protein